MLDFGGVVISRSRIAIIERRHETGLLIPVQRMDYYRVDRAWTAASDFSAWWHGLKVQQVNIYGHCALKPGIILTAGVELLNPVLYLHVVEIQMARLGEVTDTGLLRLNYQDRAEYEADQRDARTPSRWLVWADVLEHD